MSSMLDTWRSLGSRVSLCGGMAEQAMEYNGRLPPR